jgi:GH24 family phage-related lysozyme (muramidase)
MMLNINSVDGIKLEGEYFGGLVRRREAEASLFMEGLAELRTGLI